jgi:iron(III) transport system substrate-binding protein
MRKFLTKFSGVCLGLMVAMASGNAVAAPIDDLIAGAKKEGVIDFYGPSTLGPEGAQAIVAAFNKKYGLNIKVNFTPSGNMTRDTAKVIGLSASGQPPEWDIMLVTDAHHGSLWLRKLHKSYDYASVGVDKQRVEYDNGTVSVANQFALPAYNTKLLPAKDVPKKWEDLLDPKWKARSASSIRPITGDGWPQALGATRRLSISSRSCRRKSPYSPARARWRSA